MLKHKLLQLAVKVDTVKSAIHVVETTRELQCWNNISSDEKELLHQP